jgi:hypothetical protein
MLNLLLLGSKITQNICILKLLYDRLSCGEIFDTILAPVVILGE